MRILLVAYDNRMHINYFPLGIAYVAAKLQTEGHDVEVYHQDVYHYPESHFRESLKEFDVCGIGACAGYYQYRQVKRLAEIVREEGIRLWLGGHLVSSEPEYFKKLTGAEYICEGEYDFTENVDELPFPAWELFPIDYYALIRLPHSDNRDRCFPMLSGRGCPFRCNFCYRLEEGFRPRSIPSIIDEVRILREKYFITYVDFADELLMNSPDRAVGIAEALEPLGIKWMCNGRLNYAKERVLQAMKKAGCVFINYGIESVDDQVLANMNKQLSVNQIIKGVERTLEAGISPGLNIIWGNIGDTKKTLWKSVEFLKKYDDKVQLRTIRPVTPYPGCPLYYHAIDKGLLGGVEDFYENKHVNSDLLSVNFTCLSDDEFHGALYEANKVLINHYYKSRHAAT